MYQGFWRAQHPLPQDHPKYSTDQCNTFTCPWGLSSLPSQPFPTHISACKGLSADCQCWLRCFTGVPEHQRPFQHGSAQEMLEVGMEPTKAWASCTSGMLRVGRRRTCGTSGGASCLSRVLFLSQDAWSDAKGQLHMDSQQDYQLLGARKAPEGLYLLFRRAFSTCDPKDYLIEVWHHPDPTVAPPAPSQPHGTAPAGFGHSLGVWCCLRQRGSELQMSAPAHE